VRKGSAFPADRLSTHREATPRAGGTASKKSKATPEGHSPSALSGGTAATPPRGSIAEQPRGKIAKERARRPRSQQAVEGLRTINDYSCEELVTALLRGMGKKWWTRDDAIRAAARRLGFRAPEDKYATLSNPQSTAPSAVACWNTMETLFDVHSKVISHVLAHRLLSENASW